MWDERIKSEFNSIMSSNMRLLCVKLNCYLNGKINDAGKYIVYQSVEIRVKIRYSQEKCRKE
jgi:hypothetical protein